MLLTRPRTMSATPYDQANVHNFYERIVTEVILKSNPRAKIDVDYLADTSCVALNHLPPRYIRHDVDMNFFMSPIEYDEMQQKVQHAVNYAIEFVNSREQQRAESTDQANNTPPNIDTEH